MYPRTGSFREICDPASDYLMMDLRSPVNFALATGKDSFAPLRVGPSLYLQRGV